MAVHQIICIDAAYSVSLQVSKHAAKDESTMRDPET
jgi:hypothetical protein